MHRPVLVAAATAFLATAPAWAAPTTAAPAGPGRSAAPAAATPRISCPGDAVVWVNPRSKAYHLQGDSFFGHTKRGRFECRKAADAEGDHPIPVGK